MKAVAEAPLKVIITGEHFVVHGAWALAAAIGRKVHVEVGDSDRFTAVSNRFRVGDATAFAPVGRVVASMAKEFSFKPALRISISSEVPEGSGLGSSAATMVALSSAISRLRSLELTASEVTRFSMIGERAIHGKPSGIDAATCAYGGVLLYRSGSPLRKVHFDGKRRILVVFSGKTRSTKRLIARVANQRDRYPNLFKCLRDSAGKMSLLAGESLATGDAKVLGRLMTLSHIMLSTVGVTSESLDYLVDLLLSLGCYGAKLTGAGGGGSVVAVAPQGKEKNILSELKARGFEAFVAVIPVGGVKSWLER
jgi:mevalonate kinase